MRYAILLQKGGYLPDPHLKTARVFTVYEKAVKAMPPYSQLVQIEAHAMSHKRSNNYVHGDRK